MSSPSVPVAAAILAGGEATRLGGLNKAALPVGHLSILERQLALVRDLADPVFIVSSRLERFAGLQVPVVADIVDRQGPLGGIYTALVTSPHPRTLVLACDMPFVTRPLVERLIQPSQADLVIPRSTRGYEPLCATWTAGCITAIRRRLDRGQRAAVLVVEDVQIEEIGPDVLTRLDPLGRLFVNVNTPHEYEQARRLAGGG